MLWMFCQLWDWSIGSQAKFTYCNMSAQWWSFIYCVYSISGTAGDLCRHRDEFLCNC